MLAELPGEFLPAAAVLVLQLHARRAEGVLLRRARPVGFEGSGSGLALGLELLLLVGLRAVAAAGDDERACALRIRDADVQRGEAAHREADDMRPSELQVVEY